MSADPAGDESAAPPAGTFGDWLAGLDDDALLALLSARPDVSVPPPADFDVLGRRLAAAASVGRALERVDRFGLELLETLVLFGGPVSAAELAERTGLDVDVVTRGFDRLRRLGLLWGEDQVSLPRGVADEVGPHPLGFGRSAAHLLRTEFLPEERATLARTLDVTLSKAPGSKAGTVRVSDPGKAQVADLVAVFDDPARVDAMVAGIGAPERAVLDRLADGAPVGSTAAPVSVVPLEDATTAVGRLLAQGLLMPAGGDLVELPREVALALRRSAEDVPAAGSSTWSELVAGRLHPEPPPLDGPRVEIGAVDASAATTAAELLRRCDALLARWESAPPVLTRSGGLPVRDLRSAAKDLELPVDTVAVVAELLRAADLLAPTPGSEVSMVPTEDVDDWRTLDNASRWARVAAAWTTLEALPGLTTAVQPQRGPLVEDVEPAKPLPVFSWDLRRPGASVARQEILGVLAAAPVGTAVTGDSIRARLAWQGPRRNAVWWSVLVAWTLAEADLLGVTGRGALASAGRALLEGVGGAGAAGGTDGPDGTRAAAKAAATVMDRHLPPPLDHVLVQADLTAIAPGPLEPVLAREIGLVADVESAGTATVFRFSESSLRRALDAGRSAADVQALIARAARGTVPQSLTYLIDDVARRHGRLRAGLASCYVRCDDPALLAEVVAARKTGSVDLRQIAPTVAVSSAPLDRVLEVLRGAGYSPAGEGSDGVVRIEQTVAERVPVPVRRSTASATSGVPPEHLRTTVTRLRRAASAADAARSGGPRTEVGGAITTPGRILERLAEVVDAGGVVRMAYVNLEGRSTDRVVHPLLLSNGYLTAYDEHSGERRTFAVSRISSLVVLTATG